MAGAGVVVVVCDVAFDIHGNEISNATTSTTTWVSHYQKVSK